MINTEAELVSYVRRQLGEPLINLEVNDDMIRDHIYDAIQKYTEFAYDGHEEVVFGFDVDPSIREYYLDDSIVDIISVKGMSFLNSVIVNVPSGDLLVYNNLYNIYTTPDSSINISTFVINLAQQSMVETIFDKDVNFDFNPQSKKLTFLESPSESKYLIYGEKEYLPKAIDRIYNHPWIKRYVVAKTKFSWGTITGKFDHSLVSGARINYEAMKSEAQEELQKLDEELMSRYLEPGPLYVG